MPSPNPRALRIAQLLAELEPELEGVLRKDGLIPESDVVDLTARTLRRLGRVLIPLAVLPADKIVVPLLTDIVTRAARELLEAELDAFIARHAGR